MSLSNKLQEGDYVVFRFSSDGQNWDEEWNNVFSGRLSKIVKVYVYNDPNVPDEYLVDSGPVMGRIICEEQDISKATKHEICFDLGDKVRTFDEQKEIIKSETILVHNNDNRTICYYCGSKNLRVLDTGFPAGKLMKVCSDCNK